MNAERRIGRKDVPGETNRAVYSGFRFEGLTPGQVDKYLKLARDKENAPIYLKDSIQEQMDNVWKEAEAQTIQRNSRLSLEQLERRRLQDRERRRREREQNPEKAAERRRKINEWKKRVSRCPVLERQKESVQPTT
jgi:hypothetical protein